MRGEIVLQQMKRAGYNYVGSCPYGAIDLGITEMGESLYHYVTPEVFQFKLSAWNLLGHLYKPHEVYYDRRKNVVGWPVCSLSYTSNLKFWKEMPLQKFVCGS